MPMLYRRVFQTLDERLEAFHADRPMDTIGRWQRGRGPGWLLWWNQRRKPVRRDVVKPSHEHPNDYTETPFVNDRWHPVD